jgi:hypothetical protein
MIKQLFIIFAAVIFFALPAGAAGNSQSVFTQKELARMIVTQFGWGDGLPGEPSDRDYLVILGGRRTFRFEAENSYDAKKDKVAISERNNLGPFSGKGWLYGISGKTDTTFTVKMPLGGEYTLKAVIKGDGFVWNLGDKEYQAGSKSAVFKEVVIGTVSIKPGTTVMKVTLPAKGAIDSFSFTAPDYLPIQPNIGWRFREPLKAGQLAEVGVSLMNLYAQLPKAKQVILNTVAAVDVAFPNQDVEKTKVAYLGSFSSPAWLRAQFRGAAIQMPIKMKEAGYFGLRARVMGQRIEGEVNGIPFSVAGKNYLDLTELGVFHLESGDNMLTVKLPPKGGLDMVEITSRSKFNEDFMKLAGLSGSPDRLIGAEEAQKYIMTIFEKYPVRK